MFIFAFVAGVIGGIVGDRALPVRVTSLDLNSNQSDGSQTSLYSTIVKDVGPSVVSININGSTNASSGILGTTAEVSATGIILSSDGIILTNRHVVSGTSGTISVTTSNGKTYNNVQILAQDPRTNFDVAFLKINNVSGLTPATLGDSSKMQVGNSVLAIGNALGQYANTVTSGIISGIGRPVTASDSISSTESLTDLFQTDAAINEGNSGGPLVNLNGQVIGLNTATASDAQNIGFSIPINNIKPEITSILQTGKLNVPYLGISYVIIDSDIQSYYNLPVSNGAWLQGQNGGDAVIDGSPADQAGLKEGDIITKINGQNVNQNNTPASILSNGKVGDKVYITYLRNGVSQVATATLQVAPNSN